MGKTSLLKAIVQTCEDIVHVDPLTTPTIAIPVPQRKSSKSKSRSGSTDMQATSQITEVYASTRAYPAWWSDLEESRILRRRKSLGDSILERNLCFVDTPGYGNKTSVSYAAHYNNWTLTCTVSGMHHARGRLRGSTTSESCQHAGHE